MNVVGTADILAAVNALKLLGHWFLAILFQLLQLLFLVLLLLLLSLTLSFGRLAAAALCLDLRRSALSWGRLWSRVSGLVAFVGDEADLHVTLAACHDGDGLMLELLKDDKMRWCGY